MIKIIIQKANFNITGKMVFAGDIKNEDVIRTMVEKIISERYKINTSYISMDCYKTEDGFWNVHYDIIFSEQ